MSLLEFYTFITHKFELKHSQIRSLSRNNTFKHLKAMSNVKNNVNRNLKHNEITFCAYNDKTKTNCFIFVVDGI